MPGGFTKRNAKNPKRDAFKTFLKGQKQTFPYSIDSESNHAFVAYAKHKLGVGTFDTYECTDIEVLFTLYKGLFDKGDKHAERALAYGAHACRPALAAYSEHLRASGLATNDSGQIFEK